MSTYYPKRIEPKWQNYWLENKTFRSNDFDPKPKYYILDMFPYPSGDGLHVGHPEGYTATDIIARYKRMRGVNVLHPMGWDAFGLPAEQHAVESGTHPRETTAKNIANFRRQIQMLGFSYDWDREINTTDPHYYKWTQWIFLQLHNSFFDPQRGKARPIAELSIPPDVAENGADAVERYRDEYRLAYVAEVPVNWCQALGTVLANEEVQGGVSERGSHPVVRLPLRQWMLRITAYAQRLLDDLDSLDWPDPIKEMQRNWIGRSEGAEVDFPIVAKDGPSDSTDGWFDERAENGFPANAGELVIRVYTTRPDTLFGATYMVLAPEHPLVDAITGDEQRSAVEAYRQRAISKCDMDRTELAKEKTGVFTGAFAVNPVNRQPIPVWIADYVLMGYGTGAIMAVPGHDERDLEFARRFDLPVIEVVAEPSTLDAAERQAYEWLGDWQRKCDHSSSPNRSELKVAIVDSNFFDSARLEKEAAAHRENPLWAQVKCWRGPEEGAPVAVRYLKSSFLDVIRGLVSTKSAIPIRIMTVESSENATTNSSAAPATTTGRAPIETSYAGDGLAIASGLITGLETPEAKRTITDWLDREGLGRKAVNYKLRDWLFSRQRYWGEPFPVMWESDDRHEALSVDDLPIELPELEDFKPTGAPDPPLSKATDWVAVERNGRRLQRETNTMPQWAGSCWYYLRYIDPLNERAGWDAKKEQYWMPVDLYVGGAEHAVLHLLYSRFWHKVLYDLGAVHTPEPFQQLVNQGMILGETEFLGYRCDERWISATDVVDDPAGAGKIVAATGDKVEVVRLEEDQVAKLGSAWTLNENQKVQVEARAFKMSKSRRNVINPDEVVGQYGADSLRMYEMFMGPLEATKPWNMKGVDGIWRFLNRVWRIIIDERAEQTVLSGALTDDTPTREQLRQLHQTIRGVTDDIEGMRFNTAISKLMELANFLSREEKRPRLLLDPFVLMLSPFAPHIAEELWQALGHDDTLAYETWPVYDPSLCAEDEVEIAVQINNKVRAKLTLPADVDNGSLIKLVEKDARVAALLEGKTVIKSLVVDSRKGKLVNFVVKG